jgi:hypothetical protein
LFSYEIINDNRLTDSYEYTGFITRIASTDAFYMQSDLIYELASQQLHDIPTPQLPSDDFKLTGDERFALAAWTSLNNELDEWANQYEDDEEMTPEDAIALANLSEITVSLYENGNWLPPVTLTDDTDIANINPIAAVSGNCAAVVWQQMDFTESDGGFDIVSTEIWSSLYDGGEWSEAALIDANIGGMINDYSVAMNGNDIAITYSIHSTPVHEDGGDIYEIHTVHINGENQITQNEITYDANLNIKPQIAGLEDGFILAYYTGDDEGNNEIVLKKLTADGDINHNFHHIIEAASANYRLVVHNGETAVAWAAYDAENDRDVIHAVKVVNHDGIPLHTLPIELDIPDISSLENPLLTLLDGKMDDDGNITILYNVVSFEDFLSEDEDLSAGYNLLAEGQFKNDFTFEAFFDDGDVIPGMDLPVHFSVTNTGLHAVNEITVRWFDGDAVTWGGLNIPPSGNHTGTVYATLGMEIDDLRFDISASFGSETVTKENETLAIAKPDVSIGGVTVINAVHGKRDFAVNLFNLSDVPIKDGQTVRLSFFKDPMLTVPAHVTGDTVIHDVEMIRLINLGGLSVTYRYEITTEDLDEGGEIPSEGIRLFIQAEILDDIGDIVEESDYSANRANVLLRGLWPFGQEAITASVTQFDSVASVANVTIANRSMKTVEADSGILVAYLLDEAGKVVETQTVPVTDFMQAEDVLAYQVTFTLPGHDVRVRYEQVDEGYGDIIIHVNTWKNESRRQAGSGYLRCA